MLKAKILDGHHNPSKGNSDLLSDKTRIDTKT